MTTEVQTSSLAAEEAIKEAVIGEGMGMGVTRRRG